MSNSIANNGEDEGFYYPYNSTTTNFKVESVNEGNDLNGRKQPFEVIIYIVVSFLGFILNLRVFFIVTDTPRRKLRHVSILVAHMSFITLVMVIIGVSYIVDRYKIIKISGPGICEILSFLRNAVSGAIPLNIVGIIYERVRTINITLGYFLVYRTLCYIWIATLVGSIPSYFASEYYIDPSTGEGRCKQVAIIDIFEATLIYELGRFILFHGLVAGYVGYSLYKIRSKIRYLYILKPIPNERMIQKVQRIRFIYINSIIFIVLWVPIGFLLFLFKVLSRKELTDFSGIFGIMKSMLHLQYLYNIFSPIIYLYLSENISTFNIFCCCFNFRRRIESGVKESSVNKSNIQTKRISDRKQQFNIEAGEIEDVTKDKTLSEEKDRIPNKIQPRHNIEMSTVGTSEMSRISTVMAVTDTSGDSIVGHTAAVVHPIPEVEETSLDAKHQQELDDDVFLKNFKVNVEVLI